MSGKDMKELEATELRLGLPGRKEECENKNIEARNVNNKRSLLLTDDGEDDLVLATDAKPDDELQVTAPPSKAQVVGWPPVRSYRKNCMQSKKKESGEVVYLKVSMDGAPYLRKIQLNVYEDYSQLLQALQIMFNFKLGVYSETQGYNGSEYVPTYQDKDGDWMLVGDVPWDMFATSCKRLRIMKASEAKGLGCAI
ncbi:auxin-induced protein 22D [Senna tora]|uniref:Auxin-induced protein n=1 Tax=Senna tora TaxID=362788 RepID=A0A834W497_9FABA|nr:auxin-induced protein 22D [Senna tora]